MARFYGNFHIHTVLSPCADITMTPEIFVEKISETTLNWIAITDHNSTKHIKTYKKALESIDVKIIPGIEVTTREEIHILIYFENINDAEEFGEMIESKLIIKEYDPEKLGYQVLTNENGELIKIIETPYLGSSANLTIEEVYSLSQKYESIFIPAHIFRYAGLITNLGLPPEDISIKVVEVKSEKEKQMAKQLGFNRFIYNTDAHFPEQLIPSCVIESKKRTYEEFKKTLLNGKVEPLWQH